MKLPSFHGWEGAGAHHTDGPQQTMCFCKDGRPGADGLETRQIRLLAEECHVKGCHVKRRVQRAAAAGQQRQLQQRG